MVKFPASLPFAISVVLSGFAARAQDQDIAPPPDEESTLATTSPEVQSTSQEAGEPQTTGSTPAPQTNKGFPIGQGTAAVEPRPLTAEERRAKLWGSSPVPPASARESLSPEERSRRLWGQKREQTADGSPSLSHEERLSILRGGRDGEPSATLSEADLEYRSFVESETEKYRLRVGGGAALTIVGGVALISALAVGLAYIIPRAGVEFKNVGDHDGGDQSSSDDQGSQYRWVLPVSLLAGGIAAIAVGLPLLITGKRGVHRMRLLREKAESHSSAVPALPSASVSFCADPAHGSAGLRMTIEF